MENGLHKFILKAASYVRRAILPASLLIFVLSYYLIDCSRWSNGLTALEAVLGIVGIWLTIEIFLIGVDLSTQQSKVMDGQNEQIKDIQFMLLTSMKIDHYQELRRRYEEATVRGDERSKAYWHFALRFETWTTMTIELESEVNEKSGAAHISVIGSNNALLETNFEKFDLPIYTVQVTEVMGNSVLKPGQAYCTCIEGQLLISNDADESFLHKPTLRFTIIGHTGQVRRVKPKPPNYVRLTDLKEFSAAQKDRG